MNDDINIQVFRNDLQNWSSFICNNYNTYNPKYKRIREMAFALNDLSFDGTAEEIEIFFKSMEHMGYDNL